MSFGPQTTASRTRDWGCKVSSVKGFIRADVKAEVPHMLEPTRSERFIAILQKHYPTWREARTELIELTLGAEEWRE